MKEEALVALKAAGIFSPLDINFAQLMDQMDGSRCTGLILAAATLSYFTRKGHICIGLGSIGEKLVEEAGCAFQLPNSESWIEELSRSKVVGKPGEYKPLILDDSGRLYLYRYWDYQRKLADALKIRMPGPFKFQDPAALKAGLNQFFPRSSSVETELDWQKIAAFAAVSRRLCIISGGPGTGKTTTITKILALLQGQESSGILRAALAAPTG